MQIYEKKNLRPHSKCQTLFNVYDGVTKMVAIFFGPRT